MSNNARLEAIRNHIESKKFRSCWDKGVKLYALELLDNLEESLSYAPEALDNLNLLDRALLNGASDWWQYSWGGCSFCYNRQIAERLNACAVKEPESAPAGPEDGNKENFSSGSGEYTYIGTTAPTAATGYIITLNLDGGATVVYRLAGSSLTDLTAKQTYPLTREQAEELRSLLGLK